MLGDHAGTEILAYLLDLQFGRIPTDIMATGMQTDWRSRDERLCNQSNRQLRQQRSCAHGTGYRKANSRLLPSAVIPILALQCRHLIYHDIHPSALGPDRLISAAGSIPASGPAGYKLRIDHPYFVNCRSWPTAQCRIKCAKIGGWRTSNPGQRL